MFKHVLFIYGVMAGAYDTSQECVDQQVRRAELDGSARCVMMTRSPADGRLVRVNIEYEDVEVIRPRRHRYYHDRSWRRRHH